MRTNIPGVFVAGEAADPHFKQVITSAGMGAAAAIQANRFLDAAASEQQIQQPTGALAANPIH
jgi:thioredoxin reductase